MRFFSADFVFAISSPVIPDGIVAVKEDGSIDGVYSAKQLSAKLPVEKHKGIICPGFVNAHCHLELSYLKGKIEQNASLSGFFSGLLKERGQNTEAAIIKNAAATADREMFENGINAVGDISNDSVSFEIKAQSPIAYHNFVEVYDFLEERTEEVYNKAQNLLQQFPSLRKSLTPHATYSVTQLLLNKIFSNHSDFPITVHHDETESEKELLEEGTGALVNFLNKFFEKNFGKKEGITSVQSLLEFMRDEQPLLLVHNTYTTAETVQHINHSGKKVFWCFCPKANLYIENRLPDFRLFQSTENCCLGTDSLASNDTLSVLEEIKTILRCFPKLSTEKLLKWATLNGARALNMDNQFGSLEPHKKPGLLLIEKTDGKEITQESRIKRLV